MFGGIEATAVASFVVELLVKGAAILLVVVPLAHLCGKRRSAWRRLLLHAGVVGLLLAPVVSIAIPSIHVGLLSGSGPATPATWARDGSTGYGHLAVSGGPSSWSATTVLVWTGLALYAIGVLVQALRLWQGARATRQIRLHARWVTAPGLLQRWQAWKWRMGVRRDLRLACGNAVTTPAQIGVLDPVVVLPDGIAASGSPETQDMVLVHELAHVCGHDCLFRLLSSVASALYWPVPLVWMAATRLMDAQEQVCDDWAVGLTGEPQRYAVSLLDLAARARPRPSFAMGVEMARVPRVVARVERVIAQGKGVSMRLNSAAACLAVSACVLAIGTLSALDAGRSPEHVAAERLTASLSRLSLDPAAGVRGIRADRRYEPSRPEMVREVAVRRESVQVPGPAELSRYLTAYGNEPEFRPMAPPGVARQMPAGGSGRGAGALAPSVLPMTRPADGPAPDDRPGVRELMAASPGVWPGNTDNAASGSPSGRPADLHWLRDLVYGSGVR